MIQKMAFNIRSYRIDCSLSLNFSLRTQSNATSKKMNFINSIFVFVANVARKSRRQAQAIKTFRSALPLEKEYYL